MQVVLMDKKGQMKIQQMAFVLVAMMVFFAMVALVYFSIRMSGLESSAVSLEEEKAKELVKKISSSAEFAFGVTDCPNCIDLDKVLILSERKSYEGFWQLDYLEVERIYPYGEGICDRTNYPDCKSIKIIDSENYGSAVSAFVSLCRWESSKDGYFKCEVGRIIASGEGLRNE